MTSAESRLIERLALHFEADGMPLIGGRLFAFLLFQTEPCSLDELAERLQVSKTSVSTNARMLEQRGLIERITRPGDRRDYYVAADDLHRTLEIRLQHIRQLSGLLAEAEATLPKSRKAVADRIGRFRRFNDEAVARLEILLQAAPERSR